MAANLQSRKLASFGKRFVSQIYSRDSFVIPSLYFRKRGVHVSVYDKNLEEHAHSTVVPDDVIPTQPNQYWAPHPQTGVFGPSADQGIASVKDTSLLHASNSANSVLEQKAFFRSLEDLDKPAVQP